MLILFKVLATTIKKAISKTVMLCLFGMLVALAAVLDLFGPPPAGDPSEFTGPLIGL